MVYAYVEGITLSDLLFKKGNINDHDGKLLLWENDCELLVMLLLLSFSYILNLLRLLSTEI
uniref:Serine-threonine protein kinase, plant-type n=1 Tax=Solanum tuberosum TaxID=4113 RepID=M1AV24_SOLTU